MCLYLFFVYVFFSPLVAAPREDARHIKNLERVPVSRIYGNAIGDMTMCLLGKASLLHGPYTREKNYTRVSFLNTSSFLL